MRRRRRKQQAYLFLAHNQLPRSSRHAFYAKLKKLLAEAQFDKVVERVCQEHYDESGNGRPRTRSCNGSARRTWL
ncbi:hypothetical protein [Adhaeretor mobilis]|nr:hypothetical protein [Adhaeretor mobilis]